MYETALRYYHEGRLAEAGTTCSAILNGRPRDFKALHLLGLVRHAQGASDEAAYVLTAALGTDPPTPAAAVTALNDLGTVLLAQLRFDASIDCYRRALEIAPDDAITLYNSGNAFYAAGQVSEAVATYRRGLETHPDYAEMHNNLANALRSTGQNDEAIEHYRRAIELHPELLEARNNLGRLLCQLNRAEEALELHRQVLAIKPDDVVSLIDLGDALRILRRFAEAAETYRAVLRRDPEHATALFGLGSALSGCQEHQAAIACLQHVLSLRPTDTNALMALGNALVGFNRHAEALEQYRAARASMPDSAELKFNEGLVLLATGAWEEAWELLEARFSIPAMYPTDTQPERELHWRGQFALHGKTILLQAEQGIGDTLQYVRYAPLVAALGARVVLRIQPELRGLLANLPGTEAVITPVDPFPAIDAICPLMSLPLAFRTRADTVPADVPYLHVPPLHHLLWQTLLGPRLRPRIGVVWWGRQHLPYRSMPLAMLEPLLRLPGLEFHALQQDIRTADRDWLAANPLLLDHSAQLKDFADTAAIAAQMDLIVTIDTSVAHLAGGLGLPVWIMLPFAADGRWLLDRDDSPWYPTARLFRQERDHDWFGVVAEVAKALAHRAW